MPRIRSLKPEFWVDRKLAKATSRDARMLYMGLWNLADEHARLQGDPYYLKGQLFPFEPDLGAAEIEALLAELIAAKVVRRYFVDDDPYLFLPMLGKHQRLEPEKVSSKHPEPPSEWPDEASSQVSGSTQTNQDPAQIFSDESARDADKNALLYGAWSMEPVAGSMGAARKNARSQPPNAGSIVKAYVDGAKSAGMPIPAESLRKRIGKQANTLIGEGIPYETIEAAASEAGRTGWQDLAVQIQRMAAAKIPKQSTTAQRVGAFLDLAEQLGDQKAINE